MDFIIPINHSSESGSQTRLYTVYLKQREPSYVIVQTSARPLRSPSRDSTSGWGQGDSVQGEGLLNHGSSPAVELASWGGTPGLPLDVFLRSLTTSELYRQALIFPLIILRLNLYFELLILGFFVLSFVFLFLACIYIVMVFIFCEPTWAEFLTFES